MTKLTLEHQRRKVIQLARRRAHRKHLRAAFWRTLIWPRRALRVSTLVDDSAKAFGGNPPAPPVLAPLDMAIGFGERFTFGDPRW